jgi:tetratricopeptide (TPR) repeat protein
MVTAPLMVFAWDAIFSGTSINEILKRRWMLYLGLICTWAVLAATVIASSPDQQSAGFNLAGLTPWAYLGSQFGVILFYFKLSFWPYNLSLDHTWPIATSAIEIVPQGIAVTALGIATVVMLKRRPEIGFLGLFFFLVLAPTSSVMPILDLAIEHRMYLPLAAVITLVVIAAYRLLPRFVPFLSDSKNQLAGWVFPALVAVCVAWLGSLTVERNAHYQSMLLMWYDVARKNPTNARALSNLGLSLMNNGDTEAAVLQLTEAVRLAPNYPQALNNLGAALSNLDRPAEAVPYFERALERDPRFKKANFNLGQALSKLGRWDDAAASYARDLVLRPRNYETSAKLGYALEKAKRFPEAEQAYKQALSWRPDSSGVLCLLAMFYTNDEARDFKDVNKALTLVAKANQITRNQDAIVLDVFALVRFTRMRVSLMKLSMRQQEQLKSPDGRATKNSPGESKAGCSPTGTSSRLERNSPGYIAINPTKINSILVPRPRVPCPGE